MDPQPRLGWMSRWLIIALCIAGGIAILRFMWSGSAQDTAVSAPQTAHTSSVPASSAEPSQTIVTSPQDRVPLQSPQDNTIDAEAAAKMRMLESLNQQ